ncbi:MAG: hypothetical protein WAN10_19305 [Candidatus Acidiferrales bacterium]
MPRKSRFGRDSRPNASHICLVSTELQLEIKALREWMVQFFDGYEAAKMSSPLKLHVDSASAVAVASAHEKSGSIVQAETLESSPVQSAAGLPLTSTKAEQIVRIAHDFNNLLTLVLGYGETILFSLPANHPVCQYANQICEAAREGARLSGDLSALVRPKPVQR